MLGRARLCVCAFTGSGVSVCLREPARADQARVWRENPLNEGAGPAAAGSCWVQQVVEWTLGGDRPHGTSKRRRLSLGGVCAVGRAGVQGPPWGSCPPVLSPSLSPGQAALSTTTGSSFRSDRSGLPVTPVSYASAR